MPKGVVLCGKTGFNIVATSEGLIYRLELIEQRPYLVHQPVTVIVR